MAKEVAPIKNKAAAPAVQKDKYAMMVALVVVVLLVGGLALYFFTHTASEKSAIKENYLALPQLIVDNEGQVVRLSVSVQVDEKDKEWMVLKKNAINEIFRTTVNGLDPQNFRSGAGREAVQDEVKDQINAQLHVDKIRGVLYTDLVLQNKIIE